MKNKLVVFLLSAFGLLVASPMPIFSTTLWRAGTCMTLA